MAKELQKKHPLIDGHNDLPWEIRKNYNCSVESVDLYHTKFQTDITRLAAGLVGAQFWSVYVPCSAQGKDAVRMTMEEMDIVNLMARKYPAHFQLADSVESLMAAFKNGAVASLMGMEGAHQIDASFGSLRAMYALGARYMTLTHNCNNPIASSCCNGCANDVDCTAGLCNQTTRTCSAPQTTGLTAFGVAIVKEMNRLGMIVDISHVSDATMKDALAASQAPVIFSHSNARALMNVVRNVPDDVLLQLKQNGGLVMVTFVASFLSPTRPVPLSVVADHVDYIARGLCPAWHPGCNPRGFPGIGTNHIGFGSDFDGDDEIIVGLEDVSKFPYLTAELLRRGYSEDDVVGMFGANLVRVFRHVEHVRDRMASDVPAQGLLFPKRPCRSMN